MINYEEINEMDINELKELNKHVVGLIKQRRRNESNEKRDSFREGMMVWWMNKNKRDSGMIEKVNRTKCIVRETITQQRWNVPMHMLNEEVIVVKQMKTFNIETGEWE
jgi:hypothetical protein